MVMPTPFETEGRFQDLLLTLSYLSSSRQQLAAIHEFLASLGCQFQAAEPYVLDIAQRLPGILRQLQPEGLSTQSLRGALYKAFRSSSPACLFFIPYVAKNGDRLFLRPLGVKM